MVIVSETVTPWRPRNRQCCRIYWFLVLILCYVFLEGDFQTVLTHPMWLGQACRANLLDVLSVTLGGGLAAGGMLAQRTRCEERHL